MLSHAVVMTAYTPISNISPQARLCDVTAKTTFAVDAVQQEVCLLMPRGYTVTATYHTCRRCMLCMLCPLNMQPPEFIAWQITQCVMRLQQLFDCPPQVR